MNAIFSRKGRTVGWLQNDVAYDLRGEAVAFIRDGAVYSYAGRNVGRLASRNASYSEQLDCQHSYRDAKDSGQ